MTEKKKDDLVPREVLKMALYLFGTDKRVLDYLACKGEKIPVDMKTLRRAWDRGSGGEKPEATWYTESIERAKAMTAFVIKAAEASKPMPEHGPPRRYQARDKHGRFLSLGDKVKYKGRLMQVYANHSNNYVYVREGLQRPTEAALAEEVERVG